VPVEAITGIITSVSDITLLAETATEGMSKNVEESIVNGGTLFSPVGEMSPGSFLASLFYHIAMVGLYLFSLVQQIYIALLFVVGPLLIPTIVFEPFSDIFMGWLKKSLSVSCWAIFGTLIIKLIFITGLYGGLSNQIAANQIINVMVISLGLLILCFAIPSISSQIVGAGLEGGLSPQSMAGVGAKAATAVGTAGASLAKDVPEAASNTVSKMAK